MSPSRRTPFLCASLAVLLAAVAGCDGSTSDGSDGEPGTTTSSTTTSDTTTSTTSGTTTTTTTGPGFTDRRLLLVGGGTYTCTSVVTEDCASGASFPQRTDLPLKGPDGDLYEITAEALAALTARPELSTTIKDGLATLPMDQAMTYDELLDELDAAIGLALVPRGSLEREMILGYTVVPQEEVVDFDSTASADSQDLFRRIVELSGGAGQARIGIISASSGDLFDSYLYYEQIFLQAGAAEVLWIPVNLAYRAAVDAGECGALSQRLEEHYLLFDAERRYPELLAQLAAACADPGSVTAAISASTGVFFTGGDQARHKGSLIVGGADTTEMEALRQRYEAGEILVAGSSAGTAAQPVGPMITGGVSYNALVWGAHTAPCNGAADDVCLDDLTYDEGGGLGLFPHGLIDSHFSERGRQGRLVRLAAATDTRVAFGVDENTALVVRDAGTPEAWMEVMGERGVFVLDLEGATVETAADFAIRGVRASYLTRGDRYEVQTHSVNFAADKADMAGTEQHDMPMPPTDDVFGSRVFADVAQDLCDSTPATTYGLTYEGPNVSPDYPLTYQVSFEKGVGTRCFDGPASGDTAFADMWIDIAPD